MGVEGCLNWRKHWQRGKLYNIHCQGLLLWVGPMPKSKWWTSKPGILKGSPSSYVNCKLTFLQQREAPMFFNISHCYRAASVDARGQSAANCLPVECPGCQLALNVTMHLNVSYNTKNAAVRVLSLEWSNALCCIHEFYGRKTLLGHQ